MFSRSRIAIIGVSVLVFIGSLFLLSGMVAADDAPAAGCPGGQGFWKNIATWPVTTLVLGGQSYTQAELIILFNTPVEGDASINLAHQLIAAKLNLANG